MASSTWILDPTHSEIQFKVKHLMISTVTGHFTKFSVEAETEGEDFMTAKVTFTADVSSVDTGNTQRNVHVKSDDFFNADKYPEIKFVTTRYEDVDHDGSYELYGDLTIRDITKPVRLDVEFGGIIKDPWGKTRAGFSVNGKISRKEFGLTWNVLTETGGFIAGDDVQLHCNVELIKQ